MDDFMKPAGRIFFLILLCINLLTYNSFAVTAYPHPVKITQPDGSRITVILQGDERTKWAKTLDGFALVYNSKGVFEYAFQDATGDLMPSGIKAREAADRTKSESAYLATIQKNLTFSRTQLKVMQQVANMAGSGGPEMAFPTTGARKLLCILIGFTDKAFTKTKTDFEYLFNQVGYSVDGATGSVKDFFYESSYSQLTLTVDVAGPYTASGTQADYGAHTVDAKDVNPRALVTEAVTLADPDVNYPDYDNDGDGSVDGVYVIYAGYGEEAGGGVNCIWAHAWNIDAVILDGKTISRYSCSPELKGNSGTSLTRIGVICHEFGHVLGAPDFYDVDYATGGQYSGTGYWDLQASGSWNGASGDGATPAQPNPYTKVYVYNWATATTLNSQAEITLQNSTSASNSFYRFNTATSGEFYLMENRQKTGFNTYIPGHGLLIYHVHSNIVSNAINASTPQQMYPVCANAGMDPDGTPASYGTINGGGCPFPGTGSITSFTDFTLPSQKSWAGAYTNRPVANITENTVAKTITLCFMGCTDSNNPGSFTATTHGNTQIDLAWTKNGSGNNVMIAYNTTPVFGTPTDGIAYSTGNAITGGGTVCYNGSLTTFNHTSLTPGNAYYYKAWSVLSGTAYSDGLIADATIQIPVFSDYLISENFDGSTFPPADWTRFIGTNGLGTIQNWFRINNTSRTHNASAGAALVQYEAVTGGNTQDWLATPEIAIPAGNSTILTFYQQQMEAGNYGTSYSVMVSTTSQTDISSYTALTTYDESTFSTSYTLKTVDLSAYAGQDIFIAFMMEQNDGDSWFIDDVQVTTTLKLDVAVMIEGAHNGTATMTTGINSYIPLSQPYGNVAPYLYTGAESIASVPANMVDWVLVELRLATSAASATSATIIAKRAALLLSDGSIVDTDGSNPVSFPNYFVTNGNNLYIVIRHRNHLAIMSATGATNSDKLYSFDFTTGLSQAYGGGGGYKQIGSTFAMVTGDITKDGNIFVTDYNSWAATFGTTGGYFASDLNLDSNVFVTDYNKWASNFGIAINDLIKSEALKPKFISFVPE